MVEIARMPELKANYLHWHFVGTVGIAPKMWKYDSIYSTKRRRKNTHDCPFCIENKNFIYSRGNVSAATEYIHVMMIIRTQFGCASGGAKFIYKWVIFIQPYKPFHMRLSLARHSMHMIRLRCIHHSYKYPMMCHSATEHTPFSV